MPTERCSTGTFTRALASKSVRPSTAITPSSGVSSPATQRSVVVLPHPEGPSRVKKVPGSSVKLAPRMPPAIWSVELSKILVSPSTRSMKSQPFLSASECAGGGPLGDEIEHDRDHAHQHGPHQAKCREFGALTVAPEVEHGDRHGLRAWAGQDRKST